MDSECSNCGCPPNTFPQQQTQVVYFGNLCIHEHFDFEHANFSIITSYINLFGRNSACLWEPKLNIPFLGVKCFGKGIYTVVSLLQIWFLLKIVLSYTISNLIQSYLANSYHFINFIIPSKLFDIIKSWIRENQRWRRNRTGRPLSPSQIPQKNISTLSKLHKTTSVGWQRTSGNQKSRSLSSKTDF